MKLEGKRFNFLGDSITEGQGTTGIEKRYHQIIKEKYNMEVAYAYGLGGTRIARQAVPTQECTKCDLYFELRAEIMERNVDAVVVFGGTNDYGLGDAHMGDVDSEDVYTFCGAINSLINKLKKDFPKAEIIFMTPIHRQEENVPQSPDSKTLADYVAAILEVCNKRGVKVIDLFKINPIDPYDEELVPDGLHPGDAGHAILAKVIGEELSRI